MLVNDEIQNYGSDVFSKLQYDDLNDVHTETVIPNIDNDFKKGQFNNVNELKILEIVKLYYYLIIHKQMLYMKIIRSMNRKQVHNEHLN